MKSSKPLGKSAYIKQAKMIIPGLYLLETSDLEQLEKEVKGWEIEYFQRDYTQDHSPLPRLERSYFPSFQPKSSHLNDEFIQRLWVFNDKWGMNVKRAYENLPPLIPEDIIVAIIDTGVDYHHEDLKNMMWVNTKEIPGDGIDNDNNGYVDDVYGINTLQRARLSRRASGDPKASHWHGTHVAGTIAAETNNGVGISGIARNVKIMAIRSLPDASNERDSDIIESLLYAARHGARVINCSFGKTHSAGPALRDVIESIGKDFNVLVVVAAGNNSQGPNRWYNIDQRPHYPASLKTPNLITVAATNHKGEIASFSNIGPLSVDIAAPGTNIFSTVKNDKYASSSGTSMATPHVAGAAAVILSYYPELTPPEVKKIITESAKYSSSLEGKIKTPGIVDLAAALKAAAEMRK